MINPHESFDSFKIPAVQSDPAEEASHIAASDAAFDRFDDPILGIPELPPLAPKKETSHRFLGNIFGIFH